MKGVDVRSRVTDHGLCVVCRVLGLWACVGVREVTQGTLVDSMWDPRFLLEWPSR